MDGLNESTNFKKQKKISGSKLKTQGKHQFEHWKYNMLLSLELRRAMAVPKIQEEILREKMIVKQVLIT